MKKLFSAVMAAALALSLAACGSSGSTTATTAAAAAASEAPAAEAAAPASLGKMTMGTGGTAGTYYAFGGVLGQYMKNKGGVDVTVVSTDGSKANSARSSPTLWLMPGRAASPLRRTVLLIPSASSAVSMPRPFSS